MKPEVSSPFPETSSSDPEGDGERKVTPPPPTWASGLLAEPDRPGASGCVLALEETLSVSGKGRGVGEMGEYSGVV
jgi:hypothetical protein